MSQKVFISYAHADEQYAQAIHDQLTAYDVPEDQIFLDRERRGIRPGEEWAERIQNEVYEARVTLFLVSRNFRNSSFIKDQEMKNILQQYRRDGRRKIFWAKLTEIDEPEALSRFQGFCVDNPLGSQDKAEQGAAINEIAKTVKDALAIRADMQDEIYSRIKEVAWQEFAVRLGHRFSTGSHSGVYLGYGSGYRCVVKSRMHTAFEREDSLSDEALQEVLTNVRKAQEHPVFIKISGAVTKNDMRVLITEFAERSRPLTRFINGADGSENNPLSVDTVRFTISELASALQAYHDQDLVYGNLRPSDVLIQGWQNNEWQVRLPALRMSRIGMVKDSQTSFEFIPEVISYLAPEQHKKIFVNDRTDQYSMGLLAIELLQGKPAVQVNALSDIGRKEAFFKNPMRNSKAWSKKSKLLTSVIEKMLAPNPKDRFSSVGEIVEALSAPQNILEDNRRLAKSFYDDLDEGKSLVLTTFYDLLFDRRKDLAKKFRERLSSADQAEKLDRAILYLLNFRENDLYAEPTILSRIRQGHIGLKLKPKDYDDFQDCLIQALAKAGADTEEMQVAWKSAITAGMTYMKYGGPEPTPSS